MNECYGDNFILNGNLQPAVFFDNSLIYEGDSVYEVLRMIRGNPVFFNDHMERLAASVKNQGKYLLSGIQDIRQAIIKLVRSESKREVNLKIVFNYNGNTGNFLVYLIEPIYPSANQYRDGVKGILFNAERKDPGSKLINHRLRAAIYHRLILDNAYEALLVNNSGEITEGSRSNVFFIRKGELFTAPDDLVLSGITRKHILGICREQNIGVSLKCVHENELQGFDSVFMTGTSPVVLPFHSIDDKIFDVKQPLIKKLRELYLHRADKSIIEFRKGS
jgi:branched-chain amino acid aminotransferase